MAIVSILRATTDTEVGRNTSNKALLRNIQEIEQACVTRPFPV